MQSEPSLAMLYPISGVIRKKASESQLIYFEGRIFWRVATTLKMSTLVPMFSAMVQLRPVVPLLVELYPTFQLSHRFKSLHMSGSFVLEYFYPLLIYPFEMIEMPKT